ncbi:outer membrane lipase/esterase [Palleronia aestuarii]|uniref:Outer membrane lipase/esterase n=1 Tax=Palleronia aestuarii TaxID=568105 RepID=A0A2W7NZ80_9RHOB|nr:SGNH/GDSL hydrolase family protein [Palleronia aestuarii]PZX18536.1 outer membrane lipase/esterase [Palleronia aestuarii]
MRSLMLGLLASVAVGCGAARSASLTQDYSSFLVLGDSLSDNGNLYAATGGTQPQSPPYFDGRFSDGPVWNEAILAEFAAAGLPAANRAFGGARAVSNPAPGAGGDIVPDLEEQSALLIGRAGAALAAGGRDAVSVWFGANDAFAAIGAADQDARLDAAAARLVDGIGALGAAGAETVLVFTLPDLGRVPRYALGAPDLAPLATEATARFNGALTAGLAGLESPEVRIVEAAPVFDTLLSSDLEGRIPCFLPVTGDALCDDPDERVFFDAVHPSERVHGVIEAEARRALAPAPVPIPAGGILLVTGLGLLAGLRRFRR